MKNSQDSHPPISREQILETMMTAIIHRGPDQGKSWISEHAALGFRRLSIIDLEGSVQPMANETGNLVLVFNGEIYNYRELRQELTLAGHRFSTQGDSEVLLHGYEEWGEHLPEHLRGMFAFAIWDEAKEQLYAARDPFGIKPFTMRSRKDAFSSPRRSRAYCLTPPIKKSSTRRPWSNISPSSTPPWKKHSFRGYVSFALAIS